MGFISRLDTILDGIGNMLSTVTAKSWVAFIVTVALGWAAYKVLPDKGPYFAIFMVFLLVAQGILTTRSVMDDFIKAKEALK
jgi:uncharacterized membrane protein YiaA